MPESGMHGRGKLLCVLGACAAALAIGFWMNRESEPNCLGEPLSKLVRASEVNVEVVRREIGTNALPFLLDWMRFEPPKWARPLHRYRVAKPLITHFETEPMARAMDAAKFFRVFGPAATGAVPELVKMATDAKHPTWAGYALLALGNIGEPGFRALAELLANRKAPQRPYIASLIGGFPMEGVGTDMRIEALRPVVNDPDPNVRDWVRINLFKLSPEAYRNVCADPPPF